MLTIRQGRSKGLWRPGQETKWRPLIFLFLPKGWHDPWKIAWRKVTIFIHILNLKIRGMSYGLCLYKTNQKCICFGLCQMVWSYIFYPWHDFAPSGSGARGKCKCPLCPIPSLVTRLRFIDCIDCSWFRAWMEVNRNPFSRTSYHGGLSVLLHLFITSECMRKSSVMIKYIK